jgi:hypothetical protein
MSKPAFRVFALLTIVQMVAATAMAFGPAVSRSESEVKAAFLYHVIKFTKWPDPVAEERPGSLQLCVLGRHPFQDALDQVDGKLVRKREIAVRFLQPSELAEMGTSLDTCHMVFIGRSESSDLKKILTPLKTSPVLTVSEIPAFDEKSGMIFLFIQNQRLRFRVNRDTASHAGLRFSAQFLELAAKPPERDPEER